MEGEKALLEQILRKLDDQSALGNRRHEAQTAFNAEVSHKLQLLHATVSPSASRAKRMLAKVALECGGDISASQEEILANASFLGGDNAFSASDEEEEEVFATPPEATQQQEDPVIMRTIPSTPTPSPAPPGDDTPPGKKPRFSIRKVRGARIRTPTPSPDRHQPEQQQLPEQQPQPEEPTHVDPLVAAVLTTPAETTTSSSSCPVQVQDFLALCRQKGIF